MQQQKKTYHDDIRRYKTRRPFMGIHYANETQNELEKVFSQWNDAEWLLDFFSESFNDLVSYFKITKLDEAVYDTMEDSDELECLIMDINPDANLD